VLPTRVRFHPWRLGCKQSSLSLIAQRCRTTAHTSSAAPRFPTMLLSPRPFGSRLGGRLGVINPELRPPLVAIPSVRDTAHAFTPHGSREKERLWEVSIAATPRYSPGQLAHSLTTSVPLPDLLPKGLRPCTRLSRAPTPMPNLTACRASDFRRSFAHSSSPSSFTSLSGSPVFMMRTLARRFRWRVVPTSSPLFVAPSRRTGSLQVSLY